MRKCEEFFCSFLIIETMETRNHFNIKRLELFYRKCKSFLYSHTNMTMDLVMKLLYLSNSYRDRKLVKHITASTVLMQTTYSYWLGPSCPHVFEVMKCPSNAWSLIFETAVHSCKMHDSIFWSSFRYLRCGRCVREIYSV